MEERNTRVGLKCSDFLGMMSDADPRDLPRGVFQVLENLSVERPGDVISRRGMKIRHTAPFTANLTATKRAHTILNVGLWNRLIFDTGSGTFRVMDATGASTTNTTFTPSPAWHTEPNMCFAKTSGGEVVVVNGIDRAWKYNGQDGTAVNSEGPACPLGIDPPAAAPAATTPGGGGASAGNYLLAYRFVDRYGNPSVLSPYLEATAVAADSFSWTSVAASSGLDSSGRVTQRELFRTLVDNADTFYRVKVLNDNSTTTYTDTWTDEDLIDENRTDYAALPVVNTNGTLNANRFVVPPSHKKVVVWDQDRLWFMADGSYSTGTVSGTSTTTTITGSGTTFTDEMIGWEVWPNGTAKVPYKITAVGSTTSLTVTPAIDTTFSGVTYVARPDRYERNTIYASEPEEPESVPQGQNSVLIQYSQDDDDDEINGGFSSASGLFVFKNRSTYSVDYIRQGKLTASAVKVAERGAFNQACHARAGGIDYLMDYDGPWALSGGAEKPMGESFANYFREGLIDFTKADTFFCTANTRTHTVRFFVVLAADSSTYPKFCFVYNYRLDRWWTETRPWEISGGGMIREGYKYTYYELPYGGYPPVYDDGYSCDGVIAAVRGTVSTYNSGSGALVATGSIFTNAMVGASIVVTSGSGKRSVGLISAYTSGTAVTVTAGFHSVATPAAGDTFVIGGIPWRIKTAQLDLPMASGERVPIEFCVSFVPTTNDNQTLDLRHYMNQKSTAENAALSQGEQADYVGTTAASPDGTFSMYASKNSEGTTVGIAKKTLSGKTVGSLGNDRLITAEARSIAAEERHYIRQIDVTGVS